MFSTTTTMTSQAHKGSQRMCAGCGTRTEPSDLVRLVVGPSPPYVAVDLGRRLAGRGVSVHPKRACVRRALERGTLSKALRGVAVVAPDTVEQLIIAQFDQRVMGLLVSALRTQRVAQGTDAVRIALSANHGRLLVMATDARGRGAEIRRMATAMGCAAAAWGTKATLGQVFSRQELGVLLVTDRGIASAILQCLTYIEALSEGE